MEEYKEEYCSIDNVIEKLKRDGVAVIPDVINEENIIKYQKDMWNMLYNLTHKLDKPIKEFE